VETELVAGPVDHFIAARQRHSVFSSPDPIPLGGAQRAGDGGVVYASETGNLCDAGPARQMRPTHLSGRSVD
jgi:hypothetical protein